MKLRLCRGSPFLCKQRQRLRFDWFLSHPPQRTVDRNADANVGCSKTASKNSSPSITGNQWVEPKSGQAASHQPIRNQASSLQRLSVCACMRVYWQVKVSRGLFQIRCLAGIGACQYHTQLCDFQTKRHYLYRALDTYSVTCQLSWSNSLSYFLRRNIFLSGLSFGVL